jgi:hypothetical protein
VAVKVVIDWEGATGPNTRYRVQNAMTMGFKNTGESVLHKAKAVEESHVSYAVIELESGLPRI